MPRLLAVFVLLIAMPLSAQVLALEIPAAELERPPSPQRVDELVASVGRIGWGPWVDPLRQAAFRVYGRNAAAAGPWYHLYQWANLLATPQARATQAWMKAIQDARLVHPNMPRQYAMVPDPLAALVSPELQRWALADAPFSEEFFNLQSPLDEPVAVLRILQGLYAADPARFADYANLALAIAVVYDVPPPPDWPHGQVSSTALARRLPPPLTAFTYWTQLDQSHLSAQPLRRLPADELKFVVDASAPIPELEWAQRHVVVPLPEMATLYGMIKYRNDRVQAGTYVWPGNDYRLATIVQAGGICIDQAYFAANVAKAHGVPSLLFQGAGQDTRHAWFGFLSGTGWVLDVGRYPDQKFVAGQAFDPQTWRHLNDHELVFLTERFHLLPLYQLSVINSDFALEFLRDRNLPAALRAAREAVNREPHNLKGWELLVLAEQTAGAAAPEVEGTLREAARALQKYPDLEMSFSRTLLQSLRARGEASAAEAEEQRLARKYQGTRSDLSVQTAVDMLERSMAQDELPGQIKSFEYILTTFGTGAGMDFYDRIVSRFVRHLKDIGQAPAALQMLDRARRTLHVDPGGQLDGELTRSAEALQRDSP